MTTNRDGWAVGVAASAASTWLLFTGTVLAGNGSDFLLVVGIFLTLAWLTMLVIFHVIGEPVRAVPVTPTARTYRPMTLEQFTNLTPESAAVFIYKLAQNHEQHLAILRRAVGLEIEKGETESLDRIV